MWKVLLLPVSRDDFRPEENLTVEEREFLALRERMQALQISADEQAALKGRVPALVRRLGLAGVERLPPLKARFMAEARGETGDLPALLQGELV